jgi:hypothetical protein
MDFKEIFKSKNELPEKCYLCGISDVKLEEDHLPPKCIFPQKYWSRLITVPICSLCHDKRDKDDEYFRDYITLWCVKNVPKEVHQKREESWDKRPSHKIATLKNLSRIWIELPSGLTIPGYVLKGEMKRINPVLESIARGHFFYRWGQIIPKFETRIYMTKAPFINEPNESEAQFWFPSTVPVVVIPGMFRFQLNHFQDGSNNISNWFLQFYDMVQFFVQFYWKNTETS